MSLLANSTLSCPFHLIPSRTDRNGSVFFLKISSLKSYNVSRNIKLRVSASLPRRSRRNYLREKYETREVQVHDLRKLPSIDRNSQIDYQNPTETDMRGAMDSHDADSPMRDVSEISSQDGEAEENTVDSTKSSDVPRESALWIQLEDWVEQYKKDSEFWGIGSGPIFTVYRDSKGAITKVAVNDEEIVRRARISTFSDHQGGKTDPDVIEKISHAKVMAKGIFSGEYVLPNNSSIVKFEDRKLSFIHHVHTIIPQGSTVLKYSPRIATALLCGFFFFWTAKNIWFINGNSDLTSEEEEMLRRKLKARKETIANEKGSVEVIQNEELNQTATIRKPMLNKDELVKDISRSKSSTHFSTKPRVPNNSNTGTSTFEDKIKEIREMARNARDLERQELQRNSKVNDNLLPPNENNNHQGLARPTANFPNDTVRTVEDINKVVDAPMNELDTSQYMKVEHSVSEEMSCPSETSGDQVASHKASSSSVTPGQKHKLIRSVKEAREYLSRKNKIQQDRILSLVHENNGDKHGYDNDESRIPNGNKNGTIREINGSVQTPEEDLSRPITSKPMSSESSSTESKTKVDEINVDKDVPEDSYSHSADDKKSPVLRNSHLSLGKPNPANCINEPGNTSLKGNYSDRVTKSGVQAAGIDDNSRRVNGESISQETDSMKNKLQEQETNPESFQVDCDLCNSPSAGAMNGNGKQQVNSENLLLNSLDFSVPPSPMKQHLTEKEGADWVPSLLSPDSDSSYEEVSSTFDDASTYMKDKEELILDKKINKELNGANSVKDRKSSSKKNWLEENYQEFEPFVEKIGSGFRENYMTAKVKVGDNAIAKTEISEIDLFDIDDEFEWMKDEKLKEIVFQVRENELSGRSPFHLIKDEDRATFFKGLEKKADKLNTKLLSLHEWIHSRIENIDYGTDGISLYDPPEKVIPRWKEPAIDSYPEFLRKPVNVESDSTELDRSSCDTSNNVKGSEEQHIDSVPSNIRNKSGNDVSRRGKTLIECSDGTRRAGKKGSNEQWQHTKKWSREFLEVYNSETDPEVKSIMKDMGKDLDKWITEKEVQDVTDLMSRIPAKKRQYIEKKLSKLKREMEMFGQQAVISKYKEYSDEPEEDYLWWLDLKFVLFIELYTVENDVQKVGFYTLEMAADLELNPQQHHVIGFEDAGDSKNFCYIVQAHLEMLGKGSAFVVARPPKDAFREAKGNGFNVTVIRKGELKLNIDQPLEEVEEQIVGIGSKMYHDKIMRERGVDIRTLVKGVFSSKSTKR